jgi:hypothetical protein
VFLWPWAVYKADYRAIIKANGLDAYFFVRFLRMMAIVFLPIWLISWVVLLPVNHVGTRVPNKDNLDTFSFGNISTTMQTRYAAHVVLAWLFTGWILYNIKKEMAHFITTRQIHLIEPAHAKSTQANTILVTGVPAKHLTQESLHHLFKDLPGGVKKIWINRDLKELPDIYDRRMTACTKLESAETALLRTATELQSESVKKGKSAEQAQAGISTDIVPKDQRPTHRLGFLGLWGKKVDTVEWAREEIRTCSDLLQEARRTIQKEDASNDLEGAGEFTGIEGLVDKGKDAVLKTMGLAKSDGQQSKYPPLNSAFITFHRQIAAHIAAQALLHHRPYRMNETYTELNPEDVIWGNLGLNPYERKVRIALSYAATVGLIICWVFPVAFVGSISNIHALCTKEHWLAWICHLPPTVVGIISGVLPPVLLAILMMLLPIVLRQFAKFEGIPQRTGVELSLMTRFFIFQVIHSFLVVTLISGLIAALPGLLSNPGSIPSLLAQNLPQSSTFFLTYIILQGLSGTAGGFLQIVTLVVYYVKKFIFGSAPRSLYGVKYGMSSVAWGTLFPMITLISVIAMGYSIISPIINGLAFATFFLFYLLYKYLFIWVYEQGTDTGGLFFPLAIQQLFVGLYVEQVCLAALFFLAQNDNHRPGAIPEGALMVVLIVFTAFFHLIINSSYGPLEQALPLSLADKMYSETTAQPPDEDNDKQSSNCHFVSNAAPESVEHIEPQVYEEGMYGFAHPSISEPQRTVWLPRDSLGLAEEEQKACREAGVDASVGPDAVMDEKGKVDVTGPPPDIRALMDE